MKLVVDTDAFCKLAMGGILRDAAALFGAAPRECGRLAALPYMLRRGRLRRIFGAHACEALIPIAQAMPVIAQPSEAWLGRLTPVEAIDPGEAQIFAAAAEARLVVVSGDKRSLRALKEINGFPAALVGRIVVLEAVLLALCERLGAEVLRGRLQPVLRSDAVVRVCFSAGNASPHQALLSYYRSLAADLEPLVLWEPSSGATRA
jgi:hypothetical protein